MVEKEKKVAVKKTTTTKKTIKKDVKVEKKPIKKATTIKKTTTIKKPRVTKVAAKTNKSVVKTQKKGSNCIVNTFKDVSTLYKNIIHWNISKLIIFLWSIVLGVIAVIPFIIILIVYTLFSDVNIPMIVDSLFNGMMLQNLFGAIIVFLLMFVFVIFFSYQYILLIKLNNLYLDNKKLGYKENDYFNVKKILKYFNLSLLNILILLIPFIVFFLLMTLLIYISGGVDNIPSITGDSVFNYYTILSILIAIISGLFLAYLSYRTIFSFFIFGNSKTYDEKRSACSYIKDSFSKTKKSKTLFKFIAIMLITLLLIAPFYYLGKVLENNNFLLNDYNVYLGATDEQKNNLSERDVIYFEGLKLEFNGLSQEEITKNIKINYIYMILFQIFSFIFLFGLFTMVLNSFYKREIK